ncbi:MAG: hypothetical protein WC882_01410 [Candidatus Gracilibacteria bacterium]
MLEPEPRLTTPDDAKFEIIHRVLHDETLLRSIETFTGISTIRS